MKTDQSTIGLCSSDENKEHLTTLTKDSAEKLHGVSPAIITDLVLLPTLLDSATFFLPPLTFWRCISSFRLFIWFCVESTSTF